MRKSSLLLLTILLYGLILSGCRTIRELKAFSKCKFRIKEISQLDLANKNLLNVNSFSDVSVVDLAQLGLAFKSGNLPLKISFNIEAQNPNEKLAALEKLDWILEVDKTDYLKGTTNERFEIAPNGGVNTLPITTSLDIREALGKESIKSIINLVAAVKGDNQEQSRIRLKIKPRFKIAGITMAYPGFIKLGKTFEESKIEGE